MNKLPPSVRWQALVANMSKEDKAKLEVLRDAVIEGAGEECPACGGPCMLPPEPA